MCNGFDKNHTAKDKNSLNKVISDYKKIKICLWVFISLLSIVIISLNFYYLKDKELMLVVTKESIIPMEQFSNNNLCVERLTKVEKEESIKINYSLLLGLLIWNFPMYIILYLFVFLITHYNRLEQEFIYKEYIRERLTNIEKKIKEDKTVLSEQSKILYENLLESEIKMLDDKLMERVFD